jgi:cytochrome P450
VPPVAASPDADAPPRDGVDRVLARYVRDVARPQRAPRTPDLRHIPGDASVLRGIASFAAVSRRGADAIDDEVARFGPVYRTAMPAFTVVSVGDVEAASRIARNADGAWSAALGWLAFAGRLDPASVSIDTLPGLDFEPHKEVRRLMQPAFSPQALAGYLELARPLIDAAVDGWVKRGRVSFRREVRELLARVSSRIFVGDDRRGPILDRLLADESNSVRALVRNRWLSPSWRRGVRAAVTLRRSLLELMAERRESGGTDLFSRLCGEPHDIDWLDDGALVRLFVGVMLGAFDTTAAGISSMAYLLASHPAWQERVREEVRAVGPDPLTPATAERLEATDRCWKETLRQFPVVLGLPRCNLREVEVAGHRLPPGTFVRALLGPALRRATFWTEPGRFDPDRFAEGRAEDRRRPGLFMPFGAGAHACVGQALAALEVKVLWHALAGRCRFRLASDYEGRHVYTPFGQVSGDVDLLIERA